MRMSEMSKHMVRDLYTKESAAEILNPTQFNSVG